MRTHANFLLAAFAFASCCVGSCPRDVLLRGEAPTDVTGTGADDAGVPTALAELMTLRVYDTGAYINWCCNPHDGSKLTNGPVDTYVGTGERISGTATRGNYRYVLAFALPQGELSVDVDFNAAQGLINQIKGQRSDVVGERTIIADCTFSGVLAEHQVELQFQQPLRAVSSSNPGYYGIY